MTPFVREKQNPLVTPEMVRPSREGFTVVCAFNAGVAEYQGETLLLMRVAERPAEAGEGFLAVPVLEMLEDGTYDVHVKVLDRKDSRYDFSDPRKVYDREKETYDYLT